MWIETISDDDATGRLAELYASIGKARGGVSNVHRATSLHPRALAAHMEIYKSIVLARASLPRVQRERIATVVSSTKPVRVLPSPSRRGRGAAR